MTQQTTSRRCETWAQNAPALSPHVVIITRGELELMLLQAFDDGVRRAEENIKRNTDVYDHRD